MDCIHKTQRKEVMTGAHAGNDQQRSTICWDGKASVLGSGSRVFDALILLADARFHKIVNKMVVQIDRETK